MYIDTIYSIHLDLSSFPSSFHISFTNWLECGNQIVVSNRNMLAPYLLSDKLELATAMYARKRVWMVRVSNIVGTHLKSLSILSVKVHVLL